MAIVHTGFEGSKDHSKGVLGAEALPMGYQLSFFSWCHGCGEGLLASKQHSIPMIAALPGVMVSGKLGRLPFERILQLLRGFWNQQSLGV